MGGKHVRSNEITGADGLELELVRLSLPQGDVAITASAHTDHIELLWSLPQLDDWRGFSRPHRVAPPVSRQELFGDPFNALGHLPWSRRLGLAAGSRRAFLVYKRCVRGSDGREQPGLYLDIFEFAQGSLNLARLTEFPIRIPLQEMGFERSGYELWAGTVGGGERLVVVTQTHEAANSPPELTVLSCSAAAAPHELTGRESWNAAHAIDAGGYDLDVWLDGNTVTCLYRSSPHAASLHIDWPDAATTTSSLRTSNENKEITYAPLVLKSFHLTAGDDYEETRHVPSIPGGEHPQIQRLYPLMLTVDRYSDLSLTATLSKMNPSASSGFSTLDVDIEEMTQTLYTRTESRWAATPLFARDVRRPARSESRRWHAADNRAIWSRFDPLLEVGEVEGQPPRREVRLRWAHGRSSAFLARAQDPSGDTLWLDFVHRDPDLAAVVVSRFRIPFESSDDLEGIWNQGPIVIDNPSIVVVDHPQVYFDVPASAAPSNIRYYSILDINHAEIARTNTLTPDSGPENGFFAPFAVAPVAAVSLDSTLALQLPRRHDVSNSLGGSLRLERSGSGVPGFCAYSDLGDGGTRIVDYPRNPSPTSFRGYTPNTIHTDAFVGPGADASSWVEVAAPTWTSYSMEADLNTALWNQLLVTGLDPLIHGIFQFAVFAGHPEWRIGQDENRIRLTEERVLEMQDALVAASMDDPDGAMRDVAPGLLLTPADHVVTLTHTEGGPPPPAVTVELARVVPDRAVVPRLEATSYGGGVDGWLTAELTNEEPQRLRLTSEPGSLRPGSYPAVVLVSGDAFPTQAVFVHLTVRSAGPSIVLSTPTLLFAAALGDNAPQVRDVTVTNGGAGNLGALSVQIDYTRPRGWLNAGLQGGTLRVTADPSGLGAPGTYRAIVRLDGAGGAQAQVEAVLVLAATAPAMTLTTPTAQLAFQAEAAYPVEAGRGNPGAATIDLEPSHGDMPPPVVQEVLYGPGPANWLEAAVTRAAQATTPRHFLQVQARTPGLAPGSYGATIVVGDPSGAAGSLSIPVSLSVSEPAPIATFSSPTTVFAGHPVTLNAADSRIFGVDPMQLRYRWRIQGTTAAGQPFRLDTLERTGDPTLEVTFTNPPPPIGALGSYEVTLTVSAPGGRSAELRREIARAAAPLQEPLWDRLWEFRDSANDSLRERFTAFEVSLGSVVLEFSRFELLYAVSSDDERVRVDVELKDAYDSQLRFRGVPSGQGFVASRHHVRFHTGRVKLPDFLHWIAEIEVTASFDYGRAYTPAILMRDPRDGDDMIAWNRRSILSAKPIGDSEVSEPEVSAGFSYTIGGHLLVVFAALIASLATVFGLGALAAQIGGLLTAIAVATASVIGLIAVPGLTAALIGILEGVVPGTVEDAIEQGVLQSLEDPAFKENLDRTPLLSNAGEGVAEAIATAALPPGMRRRGNNRQLHDYQTVVIDEGVCRLLRED